MRRARTSMLVLLMLFAFGACEAGSPTGGTSTSDAAAPAAKADVAIPAATAQVAQGPQATSATDAWARSCRFLIEVDGHPDRNALIYERRGVADLVGFLPNGGWFLIRPTTQKVFVLADGTVETGSDDSVRLLAEPTDQGAVLTLTPSGLTFDVAGRWLRVIPTPPLLGKTTPDAFLDMCPEFRAREEAYVPDAEAVKEISSCSRDLTLEIYFGSWCPHCQQVLPKLFKCLRVADNARLKVKMIGLPREFGAEPEVQQRNIHGVPTVIIYDAGSEVGRLTGSEQPSVERALADLVGGSS